METETTATDVEKHLEIIDKMIDLRLRLAAIESEIQAVQPEFYLACAAISDDKIETPRATISRRFTAGRWEYSPPIVQMEEDLKRLKKDFQKKHEPTEGREVIWAVRLTGGDDLRNF
ncbi:hypothetical protein [Gloeobacter morelensis]|uniref:Uncharacterized protein n=1 Tax=Gloeobacter morelensis MG652769 TaxID=2781736 RepID=A0ABY3PK52_9CYAN|nr:hypothetical protein [Gloeobacter morelensis]UFP94027.1 hypothetical protein ISF26_20030 [Gloeobacter morelensis MG652769]